MVAVPPMGNRDFQMRNLTIIAFLMATTSLASAAGNEFFIGQIGDTNNALVGQTNGNNKQGTIQAGKKNNALTTQVVRRADRNSTSPACQFGAHNSAVVGQTGGNNTQGTLQVRRRQRCNHQQTTSAKARHQRLYHGSVRLRQQRADYSDLDGRRFAPVRQGRQQRLRPAADWLRQHCNHRPELGRHGQPALGTARNGVDNNSTAVQIGGKNFALVSQDGTRRRRPRRCSNDSFVGQFGWHNAAVVGQIGGNNSQGTLQFGAQNGATTGQTALNSVQDQRLSPSRAATATTR